MKKYNNNFRFTIFYDLILILIPNTILNPSKKLVKIKHIIYRQSHEYLLTDTHILYTMKKIII